LKDSLRKLIACVAACIFVAGAGHFASTLDRLFPNFQTAVAAAQQPSQSEVRQELIADGQKIAAQFLNREYEAVEARFDSTMKEMLPLDKLKEARESLDERLGAFKTQHGVRAEKYQQYDVVFVTWEFERMTVDLRLVFDPAGRIAGLLFQPSQSGSTFSPPAYADTTAFCEKEVTVGSGEWALPGTLSLPGGGGPFPAVVLVHGSGPNDRDETVAANKPFRDLAWGLASKGIAVLRYEKRTKQHAMKFTPEVIAKLTVKEESVDDALLAVDLLRHTEEIDAGRVFVLGHSLGATVAPRIGSADPGIAGLIIMAGITRPLEDVLYEQVSYISNLDDTLTAEEKESLEALSAQIGRVKGPALSDSIPAAELPLGLPAHYWLDLRDYHPAQTAKGLPMPMLVLQGGRDYQVTSADFEGWKEELSSREDVVFKWYPDLNHLFIAGEGKSTPAEYGAAGHVDVGVIGDIAGWIAVRR